MEKKKTSRTDLEKKKPMFFQLGLLTVLVFSLIAFEWSSKDLIISNLGDVNGIIVEEEMTPITKQDEVKPPPPPPPQIPEIIQIVDDDVFIDNEILIQDIEAKHNTKIELIKYDYEEEEDLSENIFTIVEDMPLFNGKDPSIAFREWIAQNMKYPQIAAENGIQGRVFVQFIINNKGDVVDVTVVRGVDRSLDEEAARIIKSSPKWTPGKQRGVPVKVRFTFPINFVLQ